MVRARLLTRGGYSPTGATLVLSAGRIRSTALTLTPRQGPASNQIQAAEVINLTDALQTDRQTDRRRRRLLLLLHARTTSRTVQRRAVLLPGSTPRRAHPKLDAVAHYI